MWRECVIDVPNGLPRYGKHAPMVWKNCGMETNDDSSGGGRGAARRPPGKTRMGESKTHRGDRPTERPGARLLGATETTETTEGGGRATGMVPIPKSGRVWGGERGGEGAARRPPGKTAMKGEQNT